MTDEYDAQKDSEGSYYAAIEAKKRELQLQIQQAVTAEREACARVAEDYGRMCRDGEIGDWIANFIRGRGK